MTFNCFKLFLATNKESAFCENTNVFFFGAMSEKHCIYLCLLFPLSINILIIYKFSLIVWKTGMKIAYTDDQKG